MNELTLPLGALALLVAACSSGSHGTVEVGTTSSNLTAPATAVAVDVAPHLRITVTSVSVHVAGGGDDETKNEKGAVPPGAQPPAPETADDGSGWVTVFS